MPSFKNLNERLLDNAHRLVSICKHLDFSAIARHDTLAVAQLHQAIQTLGIRVNRRSKNSDPNDVAVPVLAKTTKSVVDPSDAERAISSALEQAGFSARMGKVYSSESKQRIVPFEEISQRSGLPPFMFVISPDFAPVAGYHGIFITSGEVFAAVFPVNGNGQWQVDARRSFANHQQMEEWVTLLSAGFALP